MKSLLKTLVAGMIAVLATIHVAQAQTTLRYTEFGPNRGERSKALEFFADRVKELSGGEIKIEIIWGGALVSARDAFKGVSDGVADMGSIVAVYTPNRTQALSIGDYPIGESSDAWVGMRAMYELQTTNKSLQKALAKENVVYISNYHTTGVQIQCREGIELNSRDDIKGLRARASSVYAKMFSDLGANMVNMTYPKIYQAYDSGLIDCDLGYFYASKAYKLYEVTDKIYRADLGQIAAFGIIMNLDTWNRLSKKHKDIFRKAGSEMVDYFAELQIENQESIVNDLSNGSLGKRVDIKPLNPVVRNAMLEVAQPYIAAWKDQATKAGLDGAKVQAQYEKLLAKYAKIRDTKGYPWRR